MVDFSIIMPCFNEEKGMPGTVKDILENVRGDYEIIIVDDGSVDKTAEKADEFVKKFKNVRLVVQKHNLGKRFAVDNGTKHALSDTIIHIDGDFTYPASYITELVKFYREGFDMVYGSRFLGKKVNLSALHKFGNAFFAILYSLLTFRHITDLTSGLRVLNKIKYFDLNIQSPNFGLETELMMKSARKGWTFKEVPISLRRREGKRKLRTFKDGFRILVALFKYRFF